MFQWLVTLFMLASLVVLFAAWTRAIRAKDLVTAPEAQREWSSLRIMVFVALVAEIVLLILALVGLSNTFAYLSALFLVYYSVVLLYTVSFFLVGLEAPKAAEGAQEASTSQELREGLAVIRAVAESLRDQGADSPEDLKNQASNLATQTQKLEALL